MGYGCLMIRMLFCLFGMFCFVLLIIVVVMFGSGSVYEFGMVGVVFGSGVIMWLLVLVCYYVLMIG